MATKHVRLPGLNLDLGTVEVTEAGVVFKPAEQFLESGGTSIPPRPRVVREAAERGGRDG